MRLFVLILLFAAFSIQATDSQSFKEIIRQHSSIVDLHERQFIYATQSLSQAQIEYDEDKYPLEKSLFNLGSKTGKIWGSNLTSPKDSELFSQLPQVLSKMNSGILAHANALKLSVLDLPRFYTLASHPDYKFLFNMDGKNRTQTNHPNPTVIELPCHSAVKSCRNISNRSSVETVALLWHKAVSLNIHNESGFIVRYVNSASQQVVGDEIWVYYENIGPRFLSNIN